MENIMETKHTPGPWTAGRLPLTDSPIVRDGCGCPVAKPGRDVIAAPGSVADLQDFANARLIAASPKLLEALQSCITEDGAFCMTYEGRDRAERMRSRLDAITDTARRAITAAVQP